VIPGLSISLTHDPNADAGSETLAPPCRGSGQPSLRMAFLAFGSVHATGGLSTLHEAAYAEMGVPSFFDGPEKGRLELRKLGQGRR
jgi:hypothetical protein